jgi:hypothetical protein
MGVVAKCKEELEKCKQFCEWQAEVLYSNRLMRQRFFKACIKKLCEPSYNKCLDKSSLGRLLLAT